ncbi:MAG: hypothetical protein NTY19_24905 [Planctomycetota bacterium]|nr:hypothetical protein [Planctomycetota bacterium]
MGRDQNTYAKRQREMEKRRKAEEKRTRRVKRKETPPEAAVAVVSEHPAAEE